MKLDKPLNLDFEVDSRRPEEAVVSDSSSKAEEKAERGEVKELSSLRSELEKLRKEKDGLERKISELSKSLAARNTYSGDAQIDDFLKDLHPFFYGKHITYVDIGAYTGEILKKICDTKHISVREAHLYEPNPESYVLLKKNVSGIKGLHSVHAHNIALGSQRGKLAFMSACSMTKAVENNMKMDRTTNTFESNVITFDSQLNNITEKHVHLLKIDVEGYEMEVLKGAREALNNQLIDVIYIEAGFNRDGTQQTYISRIDSFMQDLGYRVFKIYEQKNEWIEDSPWLRRCNLAYMSKNFSKSNPYKLVMEISALKKSIKKL